MIPVFSGCGLVLDFGADFDGGPGLDGEATIDARAPDTDARRDAAVADGPSDAPRDASPLDGASPIDAAGTCPLPCGLAAQCGCSSDQACQYTGTVGVHCATAGSAPAGTYCMRETECARGLTCTWIFGVRNGVCVSFCDDHADCGDPAAKCVEIPSVDQAGVCSFPCDPLDATSCPADLQACDVVLRRTFDGTPSTPVTVCRTVGAAPEGGPCTNSTDCVAEATCRAGTCRLFCDRAAPSCPAGSACIARTPPWRIGATEYGLCE